MKVKNRKFSYAEVRMIIEEQHALAARKYVQIEIENIDIIGNDDFYTLDAPVRFINCRFTQDLIFLMCTITHDITMDNCSFFKNVGFMDVNITGKLHFFNCRIRKDFTVLGRNELSELFLGMNYCNKIVMGNLGNILREKLLIKQIDISGGKNSNRIKEISISAESFFDKLLISNINVNKISLYYGDLSSEIKIFSCNINTLRLAGLINNGKLKLLNCRALENVGEKSNLIIDECNLAGAEFYQFDFSSYDEFNIMNSSLSESLFVNCKWRDNIYSRIDEKSERHIEYLENNKRINNKKDNYRQIKYALSTQGDYVNEKFFHSLEMNAYNESLEWSVDNLGTKLILIFSRRTSNYGQSLMWPIVWLIAINLTCFIFLINVFRYDNYSIFSNTNLASSINATAEFLRLINPLHKNEPEFTGGKLIIDLFMRVCSSYMIYNIIRATRRFIS
ncbi:MAG TPA: hypothetical protein VK718_07820 [Ferruginibacter sp.]|jgi:hypothetical protein|nr:hypothetical protein [Ferruginibacter sp.]